MKDIINRIYPEHKDYINQQIQKLITKHKTKEVMKPLNEKDSMLITYGDSLLDGSKNPLAVLNEFLLEYVEDSVSAVHLLPMFPYTSDDGFSVVDYLKINPELGNWNNIEQLSKSYDLMFDAVINHISKSSDWFKKYQERDNDYKDFFIECDETIDYSQVVRPRSLPLYYKYQTDDGEKLLWATFSEDQLDLNYQSPYVFVKVLDVLMEYARRGARFIRFDAIGFIWKKIGTTCIHLEETHLLVKLMRQVLQECYPNTRIISETNVPHAENITYFGNGHDEAHMIYQFPLPPLTLFSFIEGNSTKLSKWADSLKETPLTASTTYFNFLASHDGIGMRPTEGILTEEEKNVMVQNTLSKGGRIGYKNNPDGSKSPYELNINYLDAICDNEMSIDEKVQKFIASQAVLLSLQGVPGIYIHSLLGSRNDIDGVIQSNINRRINREKLDLQEIKAELNNVESLRFKVMNEYIRLLNVRKNQTAFSPSSDQKVVFLDHRVFSLIRIDAKTKQQILVLVNVSNEEVVLNTDYKGVNLLNGETEVATMHLSPYQYSWIDLGGIS